ncbi:hypothetical protein LZ32DRAFT_623239 [Colletotrichum eremochloae]|nr:hypothetical protein LZ32DRAFT_623239 [Colletotrichum eremochloae]
MRSIYRLLVLLWSLSITFAVSSTLPWRKPSLSIPYSPNVPYDPGTPAMPSKPNSPNPPNPTGPPGKFSRRSSKDIHDAAVKRAPPPGRTPLRYAGDIYTVAVEGYDYQVFTPYYRFGRVPVARFRFPTEAGMTNQIIITHAYNGRESRHDDGTPRLYLSQMIKIITTNHAHKSLSSINKVVVESITNEKTLAAVKRCYAEWRAASTSGNVRYNPLKVTVNPSNKTWRDIRMTPFFKAANFAFEDNEMAVKSVDIISEPEIDLVLHMASLA